MKNAETKVVDYAGTNTYLNTQNQILAKDIQVNHFYTAELEKMNRTMQGEHTAAQTARTNVEAQAMIKRLLLSQLTFLLRHLIRPFFSLGVNLML